ncbi:MAG: argininosuccinate lyase [SAR324 cluster bacterium]|nr:argininosuccinate lyase [SAR324 cluster bacterium]
MKGKKNQIWGGHLTQSPDRLMVEFCAGRDVAALPMADETLLPFDLWTNRAHAIMLHKQSILKTPALRAILKALTALEKDWEAGRFHLDPALEDVHVNVERYVTRSAGSDAGGRLHTGRSRNDQVACDMRLFMRARLLEMGEGLGQLIVSLLGQAHEHSETLMPGFSHHQPAMVTSWGHWLCAHVQALMRDLERIHAAFDLVNRSPLGAVAGFGTSWPIDRETTAELLAFPTVDYNTLDCISARWEHEAHVAHTCTMAMRHLSLIAQDLIMLSHPYWGMLSLADSYVTGSSIMPQKRNPDLAEVIKGKTAWATGITAGLLGSNHGAMSGYNRDSQLTKYAVMDLLRECLPAPSVLKGAMETLTVHADVMAARLKQGFLGAADFADALARGQGLPFRKAYDITANAVRYAGDAGEITPKAAGKALREAGLGTKAVSGLLGVLADSAALLGQRQHTGAPAKYPVRVQVEAFLWRVSGMTDFIPKHRRTIEAAHERCRAYRP